MTRAPHELQARRDYDKKRSQALWRKWYGTARWKSLRAQILAINPLCWMCQQEGKVEPATVVDHHKPHRGDPVLFWDWRNLRGVCTPHHDGPKQSEDRTGVAVGCDEAGVPFDAGSHWNA